MASSPHLKPHVETTFISFSGFTGDSPYLQIAANSWLFLFQLY